jgi:Transposase IS116/IS110/IS902 family
MNDENENINDFDLDAIIDNKTDYEDKPALRKKAKELKLMASNASAMETRALVDTYYTIQRDRIRMGNRMSAISRETDITSNGSMMDFFVKEFIGMEELAKAPLKAYVESRVDGRWLLSITGIGPVLAATMLAHFDVTKTTSASGFEKFAGIAPNVEWNKGEKRPFNATLKKTMFLLGESFVKQSNRESAFYGHFYKAKKQHEIMLNESGKLAETALNYLNKAKSGNIQVTNEEDKTWRDTLREGKLPPFLIDKRARRKAVSLFVSHLFVVMYEVQHGKSPEHKPYVFDIMGHKDYISPPNWPMI